MSSSRTSQPQDLSSDPLVLRLKGAPLSVLVTLAGGVAQSCKELAEGTGWWHGTVREALALLDEMGLAQRTGFRAWELCQGVNVAALLGMAVRGPQSETASRDEKEVQDAFEDLWLQLTSQAETRSQHTSAQTRPSPTETRSHPVSPPKARRERTSPPQSYPQPAPETQVRISHTPAQMRPDQGSTNGVTDFAPPEARSGRASPPQVRSERTSQDTHDGVGVGDYYEQDHDLEHKNQQQTTANQALLDELRRLNPPFANAAAWLQTAPHALVAAWLRYLDAMSGEERRSIRNEAAFLRAKIAAGDPPPQPRTGRGGRAPCAACGKPYFDSYGTCLVCAGVVLF